MSYFNSRFQGASVPMTDARQTKQFIANIQNQEKQRKERSKALAEDQKRLGMIAQGLGLEKGEVDSMSRGELQGFIDMTLQKQQTEKARQQQAMDLAKFSLDRQKAKTNELIAQSQFINAQANAGTLAYNREMAERERAQQELYNQGMMNLGSALGGNQPPQVPQGPQVAPFGGGAPDPGMAPTLDKFAPPAPQGTGMVAPAPSMSPQPPTPQQRFSNVMNANIPPSLKQDVAKKVLPDMINPPPPPQEKDSPDDVLLKELAKVTAKDYNAWQTQGGIESAREKMMRIKSVKAKLESGEIETGTLVQAIGGIVEKFLQPDAVGAKQALETIFQENLRETIGAQFTENEAKMFLARAYDPQLPNKTNIEKINYALSAMNTLQNYKAQYFDTFQREGAQGVRMFKFDPNQSAFDEDGAKQLGSGNRGGSFTPPSIPGTTIRSL